MLCSATIAKTSPDMHGDSACACPWHVLVRGVVAAATLQQLHQSRELQDL